VIRLHDLCHTPATLLLADGVPVEVVSERLGHASATIPLPVCQHVHPGTGRQADRLAALLGIRGVHHHAGVARAPEALQRDIPGFPTCRNTRARCVRGATRYSRTRLSRCEG